MSGRARGFWIVLVVILVLGGFLGASLLRNRDRGLEEVRVESLERAPIESWVRAPGKVEPVRTVQISSNVQGRVSVLEVEEGDRVRAGSLLLRLDDERYRSQATQMRSRLEAAVAQLRVAEAQKARAKQDLERKERLFQQSLISPEGIEEAATTARVETARTEAAREEVESTRAQLEQAEADLEETVFFAPISGIVTALNIEKGENVITGTMNNPGTVILTLAELDTMQVLAEVDETDVVRIEEDQQARIEVHALQGNGLTGFVTSVGQSGRAASGSGEGTNFHVEVRIDDPPPTLRPGMSADVEILTGSRTDALVVPIQALTAQPESRVAEWRAEVEEDGKPGRRSRRAGRRSSVDDESPTPALEEERIEGLFVIRDDVARFHEVELGLRSETHVELVSVVPELEVGAEVITGPYRTLRDLEEGDGVRPESSKDRRSRR